MPDQADGETKLTFERALRWYADAYDLRSLRLRYFNAVGASLINGRHDPETHLTSAWQWMQAHSLHRQAS